MNLPLVVLKPNQHKGYEVIELHFKKNESLLRVLRNLHNIRWSSTLQCWYAPNTKETKQCLIHLAEGNANLDYSAFKKNQVLISESKHESNELGIKQISISNYNKTLQVLPALNDEAEKKIDAFKYWLASKRYSENTIVTYIDALKTFLRYFAHKSIVEINNNDVIAFNNNYIIKNQLSASFQNQIVNAIKLFFRTIELKSMETELIHRPKRARLLPNVLSKEEVKLILNALRNIKHKAMLSLVYACGLRRGELLNLKLSDIDSNRKLLMIRQAKGKKDRIVPLSDKIIELLRQYYLAYKPIDWVFTGQHEGEAYDERSLANVLKQAVLKAGITKPVSLHWLRHSYATHLLENGTDLRYIQEILGHSRSTTTEIYTHVSTKGIQNVVSPFDTL